MKDIAKAEAFSKRLRQALEAKGMTQKRLADLTGITTVSISRYMNGQRMPDVVSFMKICTALEADVYWVLLGKVKENKNETC